MRAEMVFSKDELSQRALPYLRPVLGGEGKADGVISGGDAPVLKNLGNGLLVAYVIDRGDRLQYIQHRHLESSGATAAELNRYAVSNLTALAREKLRVERRSNVFFVFLDGNFEASLTLVDSLWDATLARTVSSGFAVAIPARDVLAFCELTSNEGTGELRQVVSSVTAGGDHLLTPVLYRRQGQKWIQHEHVEVRN
jgi:uncharacterized protein YtpQ (UPF0354 family)